jgi:Fe-S-cluster containining protein
MEAGLQQLPRPEQDHIAKHINATASGVRNVDGFVTCPFLDRNRRICLVYDQRPAACRQYGFYVARTHNQWCADIQAMYDDGDLDGVVLGNYTAVNRQLQQHFGRSRPVTEWFSASETEKDA